MNYIISYPRSGNTAFRYIIEILTRQPTNGLCGEPNKKDNLQKPLLHQGKNFIAHKRHDFKGVQPSDFVFFIIRHPIEAVIRHNESKRGLELSKMIKYIDSYMDLLESYHKHGNGIVIYYEELLKIASSKSRKLYRNAQSDSLDFHRKKLKDSDLDSLMQYVSKQKLFPIYLNHYKK